MTSAGSEGAAGVSALKGGTTVRFDQVVVRRGTFVLGPVSFELHPGEIFCLVGANGAGKTTLLMTLVGLLAPTSGTVEVLGRPILGRPSELLRALGLVADDPNDLLIELTAEELWELHALAQARLGGTLSSLRANASNLARRLGFTPPPFPAATYSYGMRKKTQVVAALLHDPKVIVMDEPRNALDPISSDRLERLLAGLRSEGKTLVMSTHDLRFAESIADRIGVLREGQVVAVGRIDEFRVGGDQSIAQRILRLLGQEAG